MANSDTIASRWEVLSGHGKGESDDKWEGPLTNLDNDLRRYIVHYSERAGAVGDLFDSKDGMCKCSLQYFFSEACLVKGNDFEYKVDDFFYVGSSYVSPAWFGYVAVTTEKGTSTTTEWINDARSMLSDSDLFRTGTQSPKVHTGFLSLYTGTISDSVRCKTSAGDQVRKALERRLSQYQNEEVSITVTGFSLGAALATLNAMDIVIHGYNKPTEDPFKSFKVTAFVFASPRVGDSVLNEEFTRSGLRLLRIVSIGDPVPQLPPTQSYVDLGKELKINSSDSPFLKPYDQEASVIEVLSSVHNMDVYLHGIAGLQNDPNRPDEKFYLDPNTGVMITPSSTNI